MHHFCFLKLISTENPSIGETSVKIILAEIYSRINNIIPPLLLLRSSLNGLVKPTWEELYQDQFLKPLKDRLFLWFGLQETQICFEVRLYSSVQLWAFSNVSHEENLQYNNFLSHQLILTYFPCLLKRNPCHLFLQVN